MPAELALARRLWASGARATAVWGVAFALVVLSSAATYQQAYPTSAQRASIARSLGHDVGLAALFGPTRSLDTVGGFTAWRATGLLAVIGAIWGLMSATRVTRGEEDAGRWELILAGRTTRGRSAVAAAAAQLALIAELAALTVAGALAAGGFADLGIRSSLFLSLVLITPATLFAAVGLLCAQLLATRSGADRLGAVVLVACYLIRVVGVASGVGCLSRLTPFGWIDATHPMTGSDPRPLLLALVAVVALTSAAVSLARRRDLGAGIARRRTHRRGSQALLGGSGGLSLRLAGPNVLGWLAAVTATGAVLGLVAPAVGDTVVNSALLRSMVARLGAADVGALGFMGLALSSVSAMIAFAAAGLLAALPAEEAAGTVDTELVGRSSRVRWFATRIATAAVAAVALAVAAGLILRLSTLGHPGFGSWTLIGAGLNAGAPAALIIGAGSLTFGWAPRATAVVAYGLVAWSFLDEMVGALVAAPGWVLGLSVFHHASLAPAAAPHWATDAAMIGIGAAAAALGVCGFARRDVIRT